MDLFWIGKIKERWMKIGDRFKDVDIYSEMHCDECCDIVHNHMDCPVCKEEWASTDCYGELDYSDEEITCENCKTIFKRISDTWYYDNELEIIHLEEKYEKND